MIPKLIHRVWFGSKEIPEAYEKFWLAWQRQYPDYQFRTWREEDIDEGFTTRELIQRANRMAGKADIARLEIIHREGGVYLDCDMQPYHHLDWPSLHNELVVCNETDGQEACTNAVIAASPNHPTLKRAVDGLLKKALNMQSLNIETGPYYFRSVLSEPYLWLDKAAFYPYVGNEPQSVILSRDLGQTYGIHYWGSSWLHEGRILRKMSNMIHLGDVGEIMRWTHRVGEKLQRELVTYAEAITKARTALLEAANHSLFPRNIEVKSTIEFEFLKCAFYLLDCRAHTPVWQLGAGDGLTGDPLRPLIINYDPPCLMLEPDPALFAKLKANYANNKHIKFLNRGAVSVEKLLEQSGGVQPGILVSNDLNIINAILDAQIKPEIIRYETQSPELMQRLRADYRVMNFGNAWVAYRRDFFKAYSEHLYLSFGIATWFKDVLRLVARV